jgi:hypothetical protein
LGGVAVFDTVTLEDVDYTVKAFSALKSKLEKGEYPKDRVERSIFMK